MPLLFLACCFGPTSWLQRKKVLRQPPERLQLKGKYPWLTWYLLVSPDSSSCWRKFTLWTTRSPPRGCMPRRICKPLSIVDLTLARSLTTPAYPRVWRVIAAHKTHKALNVSVAVTGQSSFNIGDALLILTVKTPPPRTETFHGLNCLNEFDLKLCAHHTDGCADVNQISSRIEIRPSFCAVPPTCE